MQSTGKRRPRLLLYCDGHEIGGAEVHLGHLLELLPERFDVTVVATHPRVLAYLSARRPGARVQRLPRIRSRADLPGVIAHLRFLIGFRPDVLQISLNRPWGSPWAMVGGVLMPGVHVVAVDHAPRPPASLRHRLYLRVVPRFVSAHVATGETSAATVARLVGTRSRLEVIPPGVMDLKLNPAPHASPGPVIGTLARLDAEKRIDLLMSVLHDLPYLRAVIVGDGDEREALAHLASGLGVSDRVEFTGWSDEARQQLRRFDLFVLPSRLEAVPLSIIEAMLAGLPVVATRVGGVAELVTEDTGVLVAPDDASALTQAIDRLLSDPALMRRLGDAGRRQALAHFSAEFMVARFADLYDRLLGTGAAGVGPRYQRSRRPILANPLRRRQRDGDVGSVGPEVPAGRRR